MRAHEGQGMSEDQHKTKTAENMLGRERKGFDIEKGNRAKDGICECGHADRA